jgi:hypothetical protein
MSTIVTRAGKGSPLTHAEVDSNFTNLNSDKVEASGGTLTNPTINGTVATSGLNFDSNTFVIDATNNRVGVGTASPASQLEVNGEVRVTRSGVSGQYAKISSAGGECYVDTQNALSADNLPLIFRQYNTSTNAERMRLDASGNLGIGTASPQTRVQIATTAANTLSLVNNSSNISRLVFSENARPDFTFSYIEGDGRSTGYLAFRTNDTERMRLDASGNLGIGTTSPPAFTNFTTLGINNTTGSILNLAAGGTNYGRFQASSSEVGLYQLTANPLVFYTSNTERMRIDSSGNLLIGGTNTVPYLDTTGTGTAAISKNRLFMSSDSDCGAFNRIGSNGAIYGFYRSGSIVGSISVTTTGTTYGTTSDYRLKENVAPMTGALDKVAQLKPVTYSWKIDGSDGQGFIAHELAEVCPDAVSGEKDDVETYTDEDGIEQTRPKYQGIDTSFLVATLTAAIQEQQAIITDLKARIESLENK